MSKTIYFSGLFVLGLMVGGCAPPKNYRFSTIPKAEGLLITTMAETETTALEGAKREAKEHCEKEKRGYAVVSGPDVTYQGPQKGMSQPRALSSQPIPVRDIRGRRPYWIREKTSLWPEAPSR